MSYSSSNVKSLIRGGQITLHQIRMFIQIACRVFGYALLCVLLLNGIWLYLTLNEDQWSVLYDASWAHINLFLFDSHVKQVFHFPDGTSQTLLSQQIIQSRFVQSYVSNIVQYVVSSLKISVFGYVVVSTLLTLWLIRKGKAHTKETPKKEKLVSPEKLTRMLQKDKKASDIKIANVPIIKNSECSHFFIHGTTGTGKSQLFYQLLDQIRERGDRAIIYDKGCQFVKYFYRENKDILLNPLDARSQPWNLWSECREKADYERIAEAMIPSPKSYSDPFWVNAARTLFSSCVEKLHQDNQFSHKKLLYYCLSADLQELHEYLQDTPAASITSPDSEKMAVSVRSVAATAIKSLGYLIDSSRGHSDARSPTNPFCIRDWIHASSTEQTGNLFIASTTQHHTALKPLMSTWLDIAIHSLLTLQEDPKRRIWLLIDELPTLNRLPCLQSALAEGRKYGACIVLGMQSISQLINTYGQHGAEAIRSVTNTGVFLRSPSYKTAQWVSKELGEVEIEKVNEGTSYGANTMRDGVSLNRHTQRKAIVTPEAIMELPDLSGYLSLSGKYPIANIKLQYQAIESTSHSFNSKPAEIVQKVSDYETIHQKINHCVSPNDLMLAQVKELIGYVDKCSN